MLKLSIMKPATLKGVLLLMPLLWVSSLYALEINQGVPAEPSRAPQPVDQELLYKVNYAGEDVGYSRVATRALGSGVQVTELLDMRVPSFWGETVILTRNVEQYDESHGITQGDYVTLFDEYLLVSSLVPASRGLMKHSFKWFELEDDMLDALTKVWNQAANKNMALQLGWPELMNKIKHLKALESHASFIDPTQFDMTMTALSLTLPKLLSQTNTRSVRVFDPDAEDESLFYELSAELVTGHLAKTQVPQLNLQQAKIQEAKVQTIKVTRSEGGISHYRFDMSTQPATLINLVDESGDDRFELSLKR